MSRLIAPDFILCLSVSASLLLFSSAKTLYVVLRQDTVHAMQKWWSMSPSVSLSAYEMFCRVSNISSIRSLFAGLTGGTSVQYSTSNVTHRLKTIKTMISHVTTLAPLPSSTRFPCYSHRNLFDEEM